MNLEELRIISKQNQKDWRKFAEAKINNMIKGVENPEWNNIKSFFNKENIIDYSHIQTPSLALEYSYTTSKFYLYIHTNFPIFSCFFMNIDYDASQNIRRILISSSIKDKEPNFTFSFNQVKSHINKILPKHKFLSHTILFDKRVKWGVPLGGFEKDLGSFPFEYLFYDFTIITDQVIVLK
ncbi:MAG: hypothetical protein MUE75_03345 [Algoriphagus sp.]|jgi:hypothetical protein|nr:hypothetical protein [Algoriphagus sp.]